MEIAVFNHGYKNKVKIYSYLISGFIVLLVGSMTGSAATTKTVFEEIDAPTWLYFLTTCISFILVVILMALIFSPIQPSYHLRFDKDRLVFSRKNKFFKELRFSDISSIELNPDYVHDKLSEEKRNFYLKVHYANKIDKLSVALTEGEKESLMDKIQALTSSGLNVKKGSSS